MDNNNEDKIDKETKEPKRKRTSKKSENKGKESKPWTEGQRVRAVFVIVGVLFLLVVGRIVHVQLIMGGTLKDESMSVRQTQEVIKAKRGSIFDANGEELAADTPVYSLWVDANYFRSQLEKKKITKNEAAYKLAVVLSAETTSPMNTDQVLQKIEQNSGFVWVKKKLTFDEVEQIKELGLPGLVFQEESSRYYPKHATGGNLIGFVNDSGLGSAGVESTYDDILSGEDGTIEGQKDGQNNFLQDTVNTIKDPIDGNNIQLTIDQRVQYIVDKEINKINEELSPNKASIVVMRTKTGEILGVGDSNVYDPNEYKNVNSALFRTIAFQDGYEPGSTMKPLMAAAAMQEGAVTPDTWFHDSGSYTIDTDTIRCWIWPNSHGSESLTDGMANSCNPVFIETALKLRNQNPDAWYDYLDRYGFGKQTAVDFAGEAYGQMPENNAFIYHATSAIGQGITASPIQMTAAISAIGNKGKIVEPRLIKNVTNNEGEIVKEYPTVYGEQIVSEEVAIQTMEMMKEVIERPGATGTSGKLDDYTSVGKTGTAEKTEYGATYAKGKYIISFVGMAPYPDPEFTVLVIIDEPVKGGTSSSTVGPYYKNVMEEVLKALAADNAATDETSEATIVEGKAIMPDLTGMTSVEAKAVLEKRGLILEESGEGIITSQTTKPGEKIDTGSTVTVIVEAKEIGADQVVMTNFVGMRLPEVMARKEVMGININMSGTGKVISQSVPPGTIVNKDGTLTLKFGN